MISTERKLAIGAVPGMLLGYFWALHPLVQAMAFLMCLDFFTGFLVAWSDGKISSEVGRKGIVKKAVAICLVFAVQALGKAYSLDSDLSAMLAGWFCVTETISIAENAVRAGWTLPEFLTRALYAIKDRADQPEKKPE